MDIATFPMYTLSLHDALPISARMNLAVVSRAAAGLGRFLTHALPGQTPRVVIGFDARHGSRDFAYASRSEEHTSELQSRGHLVCRLLLEKKNHNSTDM